MAHTERETQLLRVVHTLWRELEKRSFHDDLEELDANIRQAGLGWALPTRPEHLTDLDWLTPDEIAHELGFKVATIRVWAHRYKLKSIDGRYLWGDIQDLRRQRAQKRHGNTA